MDVKFDQLNLQGFRIKKDKFTCCAESWQCDKPDLLTGWPFDDRGIKSGLVANKENMRTLFDDELISFLKWIAPYALSSVPRDMLRGTTYTVYLVR